MDGKLHNGFEVNRLPEHKRVQRDSFCGGMQKPFLPLLAFISVLFPSFFFVFGRKFLADSMPSMGGVLPSPRSSLQCALSACQ